LNKIADTVVLKKAYLFLFLFTLAISPVLLAQETAIYKNELETFLAAKQALQVENYALAQQLFNDYLLKSKDPKQTQQALQVEATYYKAYCTFMLKRPTALDELTRFVGEYGSNRRYSSMANYHLGGLHFVNKKYKTAISCYEQVDSPDLTKAEREQFNFQMGYSNFSLKNFEDAELFLNQTLSYRGKHYYDANYYLGIMAYENGDYLSALDYFKEIEKQERYKDLVPYYIAQIYFQQNKLDEMLAYAEPKLKQRSIKYKQELHKLIGLVYYQRLDFEKALPHLEFYVEKSRKVEKEDLYMLGYTQYQFGQYNKAINNFLPLNTLETELGQNALFHLADCYIKTNDLLSAKTAFQGAARLNFDDSIIENSLFNSAKLSFEMGKYNDAVSELKAFINQYPNSKNIVEAKSLLGKSFEVTNDFKAALETLESLDNLTPELKRTYQKMAYARGLEMYVDNKKQAALTHFNKALKYTPDNRTHALTRFWMGTAYNDLGNTAKAEEFLTDYIRMAGNTSEGKVSPATANYALGYIYFNSKKYKKAKKYFDNVPTLMKPADMQKSDLLQKIYPDAILRLADCNFKLRNYKAAQNHYNEIINRNAYGADYATFQKGIIAGLNNDFSNKIKTLKGLTTNYPKSYYKDDALYEIGITQAFTENFQGAIQTYSQLVAEHPKSKFKRKAELEIGLAYYRLNNKQRAVQTFEKVIKSAPKSMEASIAMANIQNIYIENGDSDGYFEYVQGLPNVNISSSEQDTLSFKFAETLYESGDCNKAIPELDKYLIRHPNGVFSGYAHFYRGDCLFQLKRYNKAEKDLAIIVADKSNAYYESALNKAAYIARFVNQDDVKAFQYLSELYAIASRPEIIEKALPELVDLAYKLRKKGDLKRYGSELIASNKYSEEQKLNTEYYLAKVDYETGNTNSALTRFDKVARKTRNSKGAEARYIIAEIKYNQKQMDAAKKACYRVDDETPSQEYWRVKAFILLADIYRDEGNLFQSKSMLQSIIDNYSGDAELLKIAKQKRFEVLEMERNQSKMNYKTESDTIEFDNNN